MMMWTCTNCGAVERLTIYPDCCSSCGGAMICDDGRTTHGANDADITECHELLDAAGEGDATAHVILWQERAPTYYYSPEMIADLALQNRIDMMQAIYGVAA
ncbi:hypothetical protein RU07_20755 [Agrobacterium tumefaciens]|uniref:Uncharacterized protein n=1 Tax=Agrobacterium tumefaciens TaxID=358 RepID=A0A0D0KQB0_AGRTU|nr:hypothetical protein RU07_20755 [Agrobacterium tumefaciens]